jgi:hypothetical protein
MVKDGADGCGCVLVSGGGLKIYESFWNGV